MLLLIIGIAPAYVMAGMINREFNSHYFKVKR